MFNAEDFLSYPVVAITFILSCLLLLKKETPLYLKTFAPFILVDTLIGAFILYLTRKSMQTIPLNNFLDLAKACFFVWVLKSIIQSRVIKRYATGAIMVLPIIICLDMLFWKDIGKFYSIIYVGVCMAVIFLSVFYFYELFKRTYSKNIVTDPRFWICSGLLFYYCISFQVYASTNFVKYLAINIDDLIRITLTTLNIFLYVLFSIAFVCERKLKNKESYLKVA